MLRVDGLQASYGRSQVLFDIRLAVSEGEVVTLLGRNGMGKTTTVRSIMGLMSPRSGVIEFNAKSVAGWAPEAIARLGVGLVPEGRQIFSRLTVEENLLATAANRIGRATPWTLTEVYGLFPRFKERQKQMGRTLSGGEQQMLAIGRALMTNPLLLILDEATEGLAPVIRGEIWTCISLPEVARPIDPHDRQEFASPQTSRRPALRDRKGPYDVVRHDAPNWNATPAGCNDMSDSEFIEIEVNGRSTAATPETALREALSSLGQALAAHGGAPFHMTSMTWLAPDVAAFDPKQHALDLCYREVLAASGRRSIVSNRQGSEFVVQARALTSRVAIPAARVCMATHFQILRANTVLVVRFRAWMRCLRSGRGMARRSEPAAPVSISHTARALSKSSIYFGRQARAPRRRSGFSFMVDTGKPPTRISTRSSPLACCGLAMPSQP